jgi:hypothetical protein
LDYGWRAEYDFAKHWGVGVEMFGQIDDLANAGSFNDQNHSIGPTLFYTLGRGGDDDEDSGKKDAAVSATTLSLNIGLQFGLTNATSNTALKFQGELNF